MTKYILLLLLSLKDGDVVLQLDVWGRLIYAVDGARGRRCGTACPPPLVVAAVRVRPSPNLPQYGRPRHCAAVVPTQPSALANCGRLSTEAAKSSICLGILHSYTVTLATVEGHRRRDECGTAETPTSNPRYCTGEENVQSWNVFPDGIHDGAAGQTKTTAKGAPATVPSVPVRYPAPTPRAQWLSG